MAVQWAGTSRQRAVVSTLTGLAEKARAAGLGPPMTVVVGPVVQLADALGTGTSEAPEGVGGALP
jgi:siroheme synthase